MSTDLARWLTWLAAATLLALLVALVRAATRRANRVIDQAPTRPAIRTICGPCGQPDDACTCADGLAAEITAYLADRPYDHERDGL